VGNNGTKSAAKRPPPRKRPARAGVLSRSAMESRSPASAIRDDAFPQDREHRTRSSELPHRPSWRLLASGRSPTWQALRPLPLERRRSHARRRPWISASRPVSIAPSAPRSSSPSGSRRARRRLRARVAVVSGDLRCHSGLVYPRAGRWIEFTTTPPLKVPGPCVRSYQRQGQDVCATADEADSTRGPRTEAAHDHTRYRAPIERGVASRRSRPRFRGSR